MTSGRRYAITIKRSAEREMDDLPADTFDRVVQAILTLEGDPRRRGSKKLRGVDEYRLRVGAYRVLYTVDDTRRIIEVVAVGHRRDVYKNM